MAEPCIAFKRPGSDLLSRVLRRSTIGAGAFHGRVRNGNGCGRPAMTTRSFKGNVPTATSECDEKLDFFANRECRIANSYLRPCLLVQNTSDGSFCPVSVLLAPIQASGRRRTFGGPSAAQQQSCDSVRTKQ